MYNAQNDVIGLINADGEYVVEYTYSAYGLPLSKTGTMADTLGALNPFRYRGYIYDEETGLYYCNSRYYDPSVGRWLNADSYASTGQGILGHNMFAYCLNSPTNMLDNTGEFALSVTVVAMIISVVGGALINLGTSYVSAKCTGQDFSALDAAIALVVGGMSGAGGGWSAGAFLLAAVYTTLDYYSEGVPLGTSIVYGLATGAPSLIWGFAVDQFAIKMGFTEMNKAIVSLSMGLTVDFGVGFSTNAIIEGHHIINSSDAVFDNHSNVLVSPSSSSFWRTYYSWTSYGLASSSNMYTSKVPCSGLVPSVASAYSVRI